MLASIALTGVFLGQANSMSYECKHVRASSLARAIELRFQQESADDPGGQKLALKFTMIDDSTKKVELVRGSAKLEEIQAAFAEFDVPHPRWTATIAFDWPERNYRAEYVADTEWMQTWKVFDTYTGSQIWGFSQVNIDGTIRVRFSTWMNQVELSESVVIVPGDCIWIKGRFIQFSKGKSAPPQTDWLDRPFKPKRSPSRHSPPPNSMLISLKVQEQSK